VIETLGQTAAQRYWTYKQQLDQYSFHCVHWDSLGKALDSFPPTFQMWVSKFASGHSAVATTMFRWKKWDSDLCPLCQRTAETTAHVLLCPHPSRTVIWAQQLTQLQHWMTQMETAPAIQQCLLSTLEHRGRQTFRSFASPLLHLAAQDQDQIGLFGSMVGRFSSKWLAIQAAHYSSKGSSRSASLWLVRLCRQILSFSHTLWLSRNEQI